MQYRAIASFLTVISLITAAEAQTLRHTDTSPHKVQIVTVDKGVRLEVLDWGGKGRPLFSSREAEIPRTPSILLRLNSLPSIAS